MCSPEPPAESREVNPRIRATHGTTETGTWSLSSGSHQGLLISYRNGLTRKLCFAMFVRTVSANH